MKRLVHKRVLPVYLTALVWTLYCLIFPLYKLWHFAVLIILTVLAYELFSRLFPAKVEITDEPEEPVSSGDEKLDALLLEGRQAVSQLRTLQSGMKNASMRAKTERIAELTEKIFADAAADKNDYKQVRRFADYFLPTTLKLLTQYQALEQSGVNGENAIQTMQRIEQVTDTTIVAYEKQLDALFADQALDIETDIEVLRTMMKKEGLSDKDF